VSTPWSAAASGAIELPDSILQQFAQGQLIAAIAQEHLTNEILMLAWMNEEALVQTLTTGAVTYWSRSRGELWVKGLTSGNTQELVSLRYDCDGDALVLRVKQHGAACHTGSRSCFREENEIAFKELGSK